jgi:hypothetical protein
MNISGAGWGVLPYVANSLVIDNNAGEARFFATGANATTRGSFIFYNGETDGGAGAAMVIDTSSRVGIGTTTVTGYQSNIVHLNGSTGAELHITTGGTGTAQSDGLSLYVRDSDGSAGLMMRENNALTFGTNDNERARIDSSGRLLVGTSIALATGNTNLLQVSSSDGATLSLCRFDSTVSTSEYLGGINFLGRDTFVANEAALIKAEADAAHTDTSSPGRLVFSTTADGASSPTERLRITSGGAVLVGGTSPTGIGMLETPSVQTWQTTNASANVFRLAKYTIGTSTQTILSITVPAAPYFISIEATFIGSRAPTGNVGTSRIAKEHYLISRNGSGSDVVLNSDVNSLDFEVASTTAGGTNNKDVMGASIQRGGAEANTGPQVVTIALDSGVNTSSTGQVLGVFDIMVLGGTSGLGIA